MPHRHCALEGAFGQRMMNVTVSVTSPSNTFGNWIRFERRDLNLFSWRKGAAFIGFKRLLQPRPSHFARDNFFLVRMTFIFLQKLDVFVGARVGFAHEFLVTEFVEWLLILRIEICRSHTTVLTDHEREHNYEPALRSTLNLLFRDIFLESDARALVLPVNVHDPPTTIIVEQLNAVDPAHEWFGIVGFVARLVRAPDMRNVAELLGATRNFL